MYQTESKLEEATIILSGVEDRGESIKLTSENKDFYSFFKNKKAGGQTQAYRDLQEFKVGDSVIVVFETRTGSKGGKFRNVAKIKKAGGEITETPTPNARPEDIKVEGIPF